MSSEQTSQPAPEARIEPEDHPLLVVDDERNIRAALTMILEGEGYPVIVAGSAEEGLKKLHAELVDVVLLDVKLPGMDGISMLEQVKADWPFTQVVMISGHGGIEDAVQATKLGAYDFLQKPLDRERVLLAVRNCASRVKLEREMRGLQARLAEAEGGGVRAEMVGESPPMQRLFGEITKVAPTNGRVLITGESGTGKELVARAIHNNSRRQSGPFVKVNCAAIPTELIESELFGHERGAFSGAAQRRRGQFELADNGTIFLDEVGDMSMSAQAKVLRALQTGEISRVGSEKVYNVDVRVLAATNKDLQKEIEEGNFREDLYFRLNVVPIKTPPLRDRIEDVAALVHAFVQLFCEENGFKEKRVTPEALRALSNYRWPGNVRELKNVIERMVIMSGDDIVGADVPEDIAGKRELPFDIGRYGAMKLSELRETVEREYIHSKLLANDWNISRTSELLGIERTNLHKKIKQYGLKRGE